MDKRSVMAIVVLGLAGCVAHGADGADPAPAPAPSGPKYADVASYCAGMAQAECSPAVVSQCGAKGAASCEASAIASCRQAVPQGTTYQPSQGDACVAAVTAAYQDGKLTAAEKTTIDGACGPALFSGPGAVRAPCTGPYDCSSADGLTCIAAPGDASGQGKCLKPNPVAAGAACAGEADQCTGGYYCDPKARQCVVAAQQGQSCNPGYTPCAGGLKCPGGIFATCIPMPADGESCQADADCASGLCDKPANQPGGNCAEQIQLTSLDSACATLR
jgi:hypothetical protein